MDERDDYGYGYAPRGERVYALKSGNRQGRINMIAGYRNTQLIAPYRRRCVYAAKQIPQGASGV